jgi:GNAT superfamily N-acetyltransferase
MRSSSSCWVPAKSTAKNSSTPNIAPNLVGRLLLGRELPRVRDCGGGPQPPFIRVDEAQGIQARASAWKPEVLQGGAMQGALHHGCLVGFAIVSQRRRDESCEFVALFVDAALRGSGIGARLYAMAEAAASERAARALYIASNPTVATVDFYVSRGARVVGMNERSLVPGLNSGIQLAKPLAR